MIGLSKSINMNCFHVALWILFWHYRTECPVNTNTNSSLYPLGWEEVVLTLTGKNCFLQKVELVHEKLLYSSKKKRKLHLSIIVVLLLKTADNNYNCTLQSNNHFITLPTRLQRLKDCQRQSVFTGKLEADYRVFKCIVQQTEFCGLSLIDKQSGHFWLFQSYYIIHRPGMHLNELWL